MYLYVFIARLPPAIDGSGGYAYNEERAGAELTAAHPERTQSREGASFFTGYTLHRSPEQRQLE